jgi:hypothetical protein
VQEDCEFKVSLGYIVRSYSKKKKVFWRVLLLQLLEKNFVRHILSLALFIYSLSLKAEVVPFLSFLPLF